MVGIIIFFTWWIARELYAFDFSILTTFGFLWIFISCVIVLLGIILILKMGFRNSSGNSKKISIALFVILLNIPALILIDYKYDDLAKYVYVKLSNDSKYDITELVLKGDFLNKNIGSVSSTDHIIFSYNPIDFPINEEFVYDEHNLFLYVKGNFSEKKITWPPLQSGDCENIHINSRFIIGPQHFVYNFLGSNMKRFHFLKSNTIDFPIEKKILRVPGSPPG